jgi:hypothetical protein
LWPLHYPGAAATSKRHGASTLPLFSSVWLSHGSCGRYSRFTGPFRPDTRHSSLEASDVLKLTRRSCLSFGDWSASVQRRLPAHHRLAKRALAADGKPAANHGRVFWTLDFPLPWPNALFHCGAESAAEWHCRAFLSDAATVRVAGWFDDHNESHTLILGLGCSLRRSFLLRPGRAPTDK